MGKTITVQDGDTLSGLALQFYGSAALWPMLFAANAEGLYLAQAARGVLPKNGKPSPDLLFPGEVLVLPMVKLWPNP